MEHNVGALDLNLGDIQPGVIRMLRGEASGGGQMEAGTTTRSNQILNAGVELIPAIRHGWSTPANFTQGLRQWLNALTRKPLCVEVGNEPQGPIATPNGYLDKLALASPIIRHEFGLPVVAAACVENTTYDPAGAEGPYTGYQALNQALLDGARGVTYDDIDGMALHPYQPTPAATATLVRNQREGVYGHAKAINKSLWITEIGWPKAVESERVLWCGGPGCTQCDPEYHGTTWTEDEQADALSVGGDDQTGVFDRLLPMARDINLRSICWFAHADYSTLPKCDHFAHFGLMSNAGALRVAYGRLRDFEPKKKFGRLAYL
jgi:hypothetical protein